MDSVGRPVGDEPQDPYKYKVEEIQKDREAKEQHEKKEPEPEKKSMLGAYFLQLFRKFIQIFEETEQNPSVVNKETVLDHLKQLKAMLEIMKIDDRSQDSPFLNELSSIWHDILDDQLGFGRTSPQSKKFHEFIKEIQHYPERQEHTLGYYLTEYAGQQWLPFPYMELIQKIYKDHQSHPKTSALTRWSSSIEDLLAELNQE
ncbi:MAG: hypothetical protein JSS32_01995 [Verrucomicrobia bacterium]|nr:hypothetical protein [Verrucomicrobiota bacterium]